MTPNATSETGAPDWASSEGLLYLVSGGGSADFFLGRATGAPTERRLTLEGKTISTSGSDVWHVQPFSTRAVIALDDPRLQVRHLDHPDAVEEATRLLTLAVPQATWATFPLLCRWLEATPSVGERRARAPLASSGAAAVQLVETFRRDVASFRRALMQSPQVATTRELDKLTELEGDLVIEMSKCSNRIAASLNIALARENELAHFLSQLGGQSFPAADPVGGWTLVAGRLETAKAWALREARTPLVRELGALESEGFLRLSELILEHQGALDTLVSETLASLGIQPEVWGDPDEPPAVTEPAPLASSVR